MGYVNKQLASGEIITYEAKLHWKIFILPTLILLLGGYLYWKEWLTLSYPLLGAGFILLAWRLVRYFITKFYVTKKYAIQRNVFGGYYSNDIPLDKIDGIEVKMPFAIGWIFNYGNIVFRSSSTKQVFKGISSPKEFRQAIEKAQIPQPENQAAQTNSIQNEQKEFWRKLPRTIQIMLVKTGFVAINTPTESGLEFNLFWETKLTEMRRQSTFSGRKQYIQRQKVEMENEQDLNLMNMRSQMVNELFYDCLVDKGFSEEEKEEIFELREDARRSYAKYRAELFNQQLGKKDESARINS